MAQGCLSPCSCLWKGDTLRAALLPCCSWFADDLSVAVLDGSLGHVQGVLDSGECSQQQKDEALELAAMLGRVQLMRLLLQHGADPTARGAAAVAWAEKHQGQPQVSATLQAGLAALSAPRSGSNSSSGSSSGSAGLLSVAAWCRGLQKELSGLRSPNTPRPRLRSLQQFLEAANSLEQRTVANLLAQLQQDWPELFPARLSGYDIFTPKGAAGAASGPAWGTRWSANGRAATPGPGTAPLRDKARNGSLLC